MGYTVQSARDLLAVGISGIGDVQGAFVQNVKKLPTYAQALATGRFPVERGYRRTADDEVRRYVISELMCNFHVDRRDVEERLEVSFVETVAEELDRLAGQPSSDELVRVSPESIEVTARGRLFVRNLCMTFDRYLRGRESGDRPVFSRTV